MAVVGTNAPPNYREVPSRATDTARHRQTRQPTPQGIVRGSLMSRGDGAEKSHTQHIAVKKLGLPQKGHLCDI